MKVNVIHTGNPQNPETKTEYFKTVVGETAKGHFNRLESKEFTQHGVAKEDCKAPKTLFVFINHTENRMYWNGQVESPGESNITFSFELSLSTFMEAYVARGVSV